MTCTRRVGRSKSLRSDGADRAQAHPNKTNCRKLCPAEAPGTGRAVRARPHPGGRRGQSDGDGLAQPPTSTSSGLVHGSRCHE